MWAVSLIFGTIVGLSLGLTGGGGAVFAVPLLVYGLGVAPREAVSLSLVVVGVTALVGFLHRWFLGEVGLRTGALFAVAGMLGAPEGVWMAGRLPEPLLLLFFAVLMVVVALQLWRHAQDRLLPLDENSPIMPRLFQRDASGRLILTFRNTAALLLLGFVTGILSGLFGVGGGFVIVPALVLITHMPIQRAVGTSLMVITLVSLSGVISHANAGREISLALATPLGLGAIVGLFAGQRIGHRIPSSILQRGFALAILGVAAFVIVQHLLMSPA